MKFLTSFGLVGLFILLSLCLFTPQARADETEHCDRYEVPVKLNPLDLQSYKVVGWLCSRGPVTGKTLQVLLHGATYNHTYWDLPIASQYSYEKRATQAGYAVFNVDRLGFGESDHPANPELLTIQTDADILHQIIQALRTGKVANTSFSKIITVGHSMGTALALDEAGRYQDVDGVIATGLLHNINPAWISEALQSFYPAAFDPQFSSKNLPYGYLTSMPGKRGSLFYYLPTTDQTILSYDEAHKDTMTDGELNTISTAIYSPVSLNIKVPVFEMAGQYDRLGCDGTVLNCDNFEAVKNYESSFFSPQACLETMVIANTGHDLNLHTTAQTTYTAAMEWANRRIGPVANQAPPQPCN